MLTSIVELADANGIPRNKLVVVHADLGSAEWEGTKELAERQAMHYGLRFIVMGHSKFPSLLDRIRARGMRRDQGAAHYTVRKPNLIGKEKQ